MTVSNLYKKGAPAGWVPDADEYNAPDGALLLGTNVVPEEVGVQSLRKGSSLIYSNFSPTDVHSLWTTQLWNQGTPTTYRFQGAGNLVFQNGVGQSVAFAGTGDIAFADDSYQVFMARSTTKQKSDGSSIFNWGIPAPTLKPTLLPVTNLFTSLATFNAGESPAIVVNEGNSNGNVNGWDGTTNGALSISTAPSTGRLSLTKTYATALDLLNIGGSIGGDTDLFDMYIWIQEPREFSRLVAMFGLSSSDADPFTNDRYEFTFDPTRVVDIKDAASSAAAAAQASLDQSLTAISPELFTGTASPEDVLKILERLGRSGPRAKERVDAQQNSPAWYRLSVTRGQFNRIGGTPGRDWTTVKAFKLIYEGLPGSASPVVSFDSAIFIGGGNSSLTGRYRIGYRYVRNTGTYVEKSPLSPLSDFITLNQQGLQVTIPSAAVSGADPQANGLWIYIVGGFIPSLYRCAVTGLSSRSSSMTIDEFGRAATGVVDAAARTRLVNQGFTIPGFTPNSSITLTLQKSDIQILTESERLEPFAAGPPDNIVAIAGPFSNRMFCLTKEGWLWPSAQTTPSSFSVSHVIDLRRYGTPLWAIRTNGGIYCGFVKDIIRIGGQGTESPDHLTTDMYPIPLHVSNPPVDSTAYTDGNLIVYRAADGLLTLQGWSSSAVNEGQTSLLWKKKDRYGVFALNTDTGRFRIIIDKGILYMLAPEGTTTSGTPAIWRYYFRFQQWTRTLYPWNFLSLFRDPGGAIIAGTNTGQLVLLEDGTQDNGVSIPVEVLYPISDGGNPLARKVPLDFQFQGTAGNIPGSLSLTLDGVTTIYPFSSPTSGVYRIDISDLPSFLRAQIRLTGSFNMFRLQALNLSFRVLPQHTMVLDTGYILPQEPSILVDPTEAEVDCISPAPVQLLYYADDVLLGVPLSVPNDARQAFVPNVRSIFRVVLPKGSKTRRPRIKLRTTNVAGPGQVGFECYGIRIRERSSGNQSGLSFRTIYPVGQAS